MAGFKETPRQKMIGMMYLVLTALLALNVSKDILNAFVIVNDSIESTNKNYEKKNKGSYANFEAQYSLNPNKVKPYLDKANRVKSLTDELINYINTLKFDVIAQTENIPLEQAKKITSLNEVSAKDNYDMPTHYFIGESQDGSKGKARELKNKIIDYKTQIFKIIDNDTNSVKISLNTNDYYNKIEGKQTWEMGNFYHTILAGTVTILNKYIVDIRNAEADVVSHLYKAITAEDFKFDQVGAKVIPKSNYVLQGDSYEADIIVAAYDTKQNPEIFIKTGVDTIINFDPTGCTRIEGARGVGKYKLQVNTLGPQKYAGVIRILSPSGEKKTYQFNSEYIVAKPSVTVSADAMNVFYIGVDNPVSISVPGIPMESIKPSITSGTLTPKGGGKYIVRVSSGIRTTKINVSADVSGSVKPMGSQEFRVKTVPDPIAYIANKKSGSISKSELLAAGAIIPQLENFDFNMYFVVTEFSLSTLVSGDLQEKRAQGNRLTEEMRKIVNTLRRGQKVYIENIKAKGPDGTTRSLSSINLTIN
ncbi:MAG: gliding motility protein GldM [Bacteroidales bacterium]|nr:gliding motility protein GldM [Bacteroidales bacterium]